MASALAAFAAACQLVAPACAQANADELPAFDISGGELAESLEQFAEQSGLQVVYSAASPGGRARAQSVRGRMPPGQALDAMLADTDLSWRYVSENTLAISVPGRMQPATADPARPRGRETASVVGLGDVNVVHDLRRGLPGYPGDSVFGIGKSLLETPRTVSSVSAETIDLLGLSAVEDLVRVVPGVYTTTRWGIQGSIDVRNVPGDTHFRGMKRINLQGHTRTVLAAADEIEVVKGPPSPLYGMGKIGGYTNMVPRSIRAEGGGYWSEPHGFLQMTVGSHEKSELSFGIGGALPVRDSRGGYYVYGLVEDSGSYIDRVPIRQRLLQAGITLEPFSSALRLEAGINLQRSGTAGALIGRFTQGVADRGEYIRGIPLVDLDVNGNGRIGYLEMHERSPVTGAAAAGNRPLQQYWAWPTDTDGNPLPLDRFPKVAGTPRSLYEYLLEHPEADPSGLLREQGAGGPLPVSGYVPAGFALDPRTVGYDQLDLSRPAALERELEADLVTLYVDLIDDSDAHSSIKNQFFFDGMKQYKLSELPFSQEQEVYVVEDRLTITRRLDALPEWINARGLAAANVRYTSATGRTSSGDYGTHRSDAMDGSGLAPSARFSTSFANSELHADGMPWTAHYATDSLELGLGLILDVTLGERTMLTVGARADRSRASNVDYAGTVSMSAGTPERPAVRPHDERASARDSGVSWSFSASHRFANAIHPYFTIAESTLALDRNNNKYDNDVIEHGHIGRARLAEAGVKSSLLDNSLALTASVFEQSRRGVSPDDPAAVLNAYASATSTRGWEMELNWSPRSNASVSFYALRQRTEYRPNDGGPVMVDAAALGFEDVLDAEQNVVYPAEAFLYGGRAFLVLPPGMRAYERKRGNPESQRGVLARYELDSGLGFTLNGNYFSSTYSGRLGLVELPEAYVVNAGVYFNFGDWQIRGDVRNVLDERYFRARTGDVLGDVLASAMPGRRWRAAFKLRF